MSPKNRFLLLFSIASIVVAGFLIAGHRDEFPGRRQGGGNQSRMEFPLWVQK